MTVAVPLSPVTVFLPPTHTGPRPNLGLTTVRVSKAQPSQSMEVVIVSGGTVTVQPNGAVVVMVFVQLAGSEQDVTVVVPGSVDGVAGQSYAVC